MAMVQMQVAGVAYDPQKRPVVVLRSDGRVLPIWIGTAEAYAINSAMIKMAPPRPMTHDLIVAILKGFNARVEHVHVYKLENRTYFASLVLVQEDPDSTEKRIYKIDCRPSDAIAIAVRTSCPVYVEGDVLDQAGQDAASLEGEPDAE